MILGSLFINVFNNLSASASSVTLTIPSSALSLDISPNSGTVFQKSTAGTINVATDSSYGYSLSIKSKNADGSGIKSNDLLNGSNKIASIVSALNEADFQNSGNSNTWGYMPSKFNSSANTDLQPGPTSEPTTLDVTDTSSSGTDYGITLATKIDNTLPAGTYHNTFVLTTTTNDPPYDDIMQNWSGCDDLPQETKTLTLLDTRDNKTYTVAKLKDGQCWMTQNLAIENETLTSTDSDVSSDFILPASINEGFNSYTAANVHIDTDGGYYNWYAATAGEGTQSKSSGDVSHSICPKGWKLPTNSEITDLANAYDGSYSQISVSPAHFTLSGRFDNSSLYDRGSNGYYWSSTASLSNYAYALYLNTSSAFSYDSSIKNNGFSVRCISRYDKKVDTLQNVANWADSIEEGKIALSKDSRDNKEYTVSRLADGRLWMTQNLEIADKTLTSADSDVASDFQIPASTDKPNSSSSYESKELHVDSTYGGYYTWYTATAGEGTQSKSSGDVSHSICPRGWRLPTRDEFVALDRALGGTGSSQSSASAQAAKYIGSPNNFKMGGRYDSGSAYDVGTYAFYWSSTALHSASAYNLYFDSSRVGPQYDGNKDRLYSVRCVARTDDPINVGTMQTVSEWGNNIKEGKTAISKDSRDNKEYTVARLADGKLYMTKNLEIAEKTLTSADSDISGSYSLPASSTGGFSSNTAANVYVDDTYGGYYTWIAATAGTGSSATTNGAQASGSICPKGWKLPSKQNFIDLDKALGGTGANSQRTSGLVSKYLASPNNFNMGGFYNSGSPNTVGTSAKYWSSTASDSSSAYLLSLDSSGSVYPFSNNLGRYYGYSVRCISGQ